MLPLAAVIVAVGVASIADVPSPRPNGWVSDQAHVLGADGKQQLDGLAERLHTDRGIELAVVTVDNVPGTPKITESCVHCNRKHSYTRHTSQLTRASDSSSSSSDSSSGFSGGSSDGGGAGSSW